jgi:prephenate dehydratase
MATAQRHRYFRVLVEDKPGALLSLASELKQQNLDLVGLKGMSDAKQGEVLLVPKNPDKFRSNWAGKVAEEGTLFFLSGINTVGALERSLEALAKGSINIIAIETESVGTRFAAFVWIAPQDVERAAKVLETE